MDYFFCSLHVYALVTVGNMFLNTIPEKTLHIVARALNELQNGLRYKATLNALRKNEKHDHNFVFLERPFDNKAQMAK